MLIHKWLFLLNPHYKFRSVKSRYGADICDIQCDRCDQLTTKPEIVSQVIRYPRICGSHNDFPEDKIKKTDSEQRVPSG